MSARLVVMTYNIRHGRGADGRVDLGRVAAVIAEAAPDVVALQEVDAWRARSRATDQAHELARRLGMDATFAPCVVRGEEQYGIATLSRLPLRAAHRVALPAHGRGRSEPRCALAARVAWVGREIDVVNAHLSVRGDERPAQVTSLLAAVDAGHGDLVLAADLNVTPRSALYRRLLARLRDAGARGRSWPARLPLLRLDHLLYRGSLAVAHSAVVDTAAARRASDHLPIVAAFRPEGAR